MNWYRTPYKWRDGERPCRYVALDDCEEFRGQWTESEISGNQAVVYGPEGLPATLLSETEARSAVHHLRNRHTKPLRSLIDQSDSSPELRQLTAQWNAVGFGQGWRVPRWLTPRLARRVGEPTKLWRELAQLCFDECGAFPTTSLLDQFNRADENPLGNGNWTGPAHGSLTNKLKLVSNGVLSDEVSGQFGSSYWSASTFGPDTEAYFTWVLKPADGRDGSIWVRLASPGTSGQDHYDLGMTQVVGSTDTMIIRRTDNNVDTQLGATINQEFGVGDSDGIEIIGVTIAAYHKSPTWTQLTTRTDSTYTAAGYIAVGMQSSAGSFGKFDDFGGGTVVAVKNKRSQFLALFPV